MPPRDLVAAFQKGQVDLAVGYFPDMSGLDILQQRLFGDGFVCVVGAGHPEVHEKLTQKQLAELVGTTQSVIARLEDADYEGHSLSMLQRIAAAVNKRLEVRFVSAGRKVLA